MSEIKITRLFNRLVEARAGYSQSPPPPSTPGVYAMFLSAGCELPEVSPPPTEIVYLGRSKELTTRIHFEAKHSGFSSPRRTLGALLKGELDLAAEPRAMGRSDTNWRNYRFSDDGEDRLSRWMRSHLDYAAISYDGDLAGLERELISLAEPPLNLTHWENPDRPHLKKLRRQFQMEAKDKWA